MVVSEWLNASAASETTTGLPRRFGDVAMAIKTSPLVGRAKTEIDEDDDDDDEAWPSRDDDVKGVIGVNESVVLILSIKRTIAVVAAVEIKVGLWLLFARVMLFIVITDIFEISGGAGCTWKLWSQQERSLRRWEIHSFIEMLGRNP